MERVESEHIERAERSLRSRAAATIDVNSLNTAIAERFGISPELASSFVDTRYQAAKQKYFPGIDPRAEQHIHVLMRHCLLVGIGAGKISEGRD